ncbi:MAG: trimeric intracellular cation channel family protein [Phormidesmis sp.]
MHILHTLDLFGTVVFATSGALTARKQRRNCAIALLYAMLTALGGGTMRDLLLARPVFWLQWNSLSFMRSPAYGLLALTAGLITFWLSARAHIRTEHLWLANAISLATFTTIGTQVALQQFALIPYAHPLWVLAPVMGLLTGVGGGAIRDILDTQTNRIFQRPYEAIAALSGGIVYSCLALVQVPDSITLTATMLTTVMMLPAPKALLIRLLSAYLPQF